MNPVERAILQCEIMEALNALYKSGQVGRSIKPVLTFDGNIAGKTVHDEYVRVSSAVMDLTKAQKVTLLVGNGEETVEISEGLTIAKPTDGVTYLTDGEVNFAMTVENGGEADGSYVWYVGDEVGYEAMVSKVEFAETIVPIDPKFLPGVCLPVVELSTELSETSTKLTTEESASLEAAADAGLPCIFRIKSVGMCGVSILINEFDGEGHPAFIPIIEASMIVVKTADGWYVNLGG